MYYKIVQFVFSFETEFLVSQAGLELSVTKNDLDFLAPSAGTVIVHHRVRLRGAGDGTQA